jgi:amino acid adenylation domain-containing protein
MSFSALSDAKRRILESCLRGEGLPLEASPVPMRARGPAVPATAGQRQIWMHEQLAGRPIYNESATIRRRGELDATALVRALSGIVRRHESWRTGFTADGGLLVQRVGPPFEVVVEREDLRDFSPSDREKRAADLAAADAAVPFDLSRPPLFRARLVRFDEGDHRLFLTIHHLIFDTASLFGTFFPELIALHDAFAAGKPSPLPPPPVQFADYAAWAAERRLSGESLEFWRSRLAELPSPAAPLPDRDRAGEIAGRGAVARVEFPARVRDAAARLARECGATPFALLFASIAAVLSRVAGEEEIVLGCVSAARPRTEFEGVLGYFLNPVVLRISIAGDPSFRELVSRAGESVVSALAHADVPYERVAAEVPGRAGAPLFRFLLSYEPPRAPVPAGWDLTLFEASSGHAKFDVSLEMESRPEGLVGRFLYDADLYDAESIALLTAHWRALLDGALSDPDRPVADVPMAGETAAMSGPPPRPAALPAPLEFARRAAELPSAEAIRFRGKTTTYAELAARVDRIAAGLENRGIGRESIVALALPRSEDRVAAILAIGRAGAAWMPLGSDWPPARISVVLSSSRPALAIAPSSSEIGRIPVVPLAELETGFRGVANAAPELSDLAYVLHTSGSTGEPKGVMIEHRPLANLLAWSQRAYPLGPGDRVLLKAPLGFDASVWELHAPLVAGAALVVAPPGSESDPRALAAILRQERVTHLKLVPSLLRMLVGLPEFGEAAALRHVFCGGEALPADLVREFFRVSRAELHNLYGPTETCVDVAAHRCRREDLGRRVPIGAPIDGATLHVLDRRGRRSAAGAPGELHVGGLPLARGYLRREDLTAERFVPDPSGSPGDRLYRTGDLVRRGRGGEIEFLGRLDEQKKVRGIRVEPGEIEMNLRRYPEVEDAAVVVRGEGLSASLAAYVAVPGAVSDSDARRALVRKLRERLASTLPRALVPEAITVLASLPLTASGKIDRASLPEPERFLEGAGGAPGSAEERLLVEIWGDVLGLPGVGVHDNLFDLGGNSLVVFQIAARASQSGYAIPPRLVFDHPTIAELAAAAGTLPATTSGMTELSA